LKILIAKFVTLVDKNVIILFILWNLTAESGHYVYPCWIYIICVCVCVKFGCKSASGYGHLGKTTQRVIIYGTFCIWQWYVALITSPWRGREVLWSECLCLSVCLPYPFANTMWSTIAVCVMLLPWFRLSDDIAVCYVGYFWCCEWHIVFT